MTAADLNRPAGREQDSVGDPMFKQANQMRNGGDQVEKDAARAVRLYERADGEHDHVGAMVGLGYLLREIAEGIGKNAERAKGLRA